VKNTCLNDYHISSCVFIILELDKVTDLKFTGNLTENGTAWIDFKKPRGLYDKIRVDCYAKDQTCWVQDHNLTNTVGNCPDCNNISISQVIRGVNYTCNAFTIKEDLENKSRPSGEFEIKTGE
jgi:hypothetical protein